MNVETIANELSAALATITGLRVYPWAQRTLSPPGVVVSLPESIDYHGTAGTGLKIVKDMAVILMVGQASARQELKDLGAYTASSGAKSIRAALESYPYTSCDSVTVKSVEFDEVSLAGVEFGGAKFTLDIFCTGA